MLEIHNGWVIGDNLWLWKADHCVSNSGINIPEASRLIGSLFKVCHTGGALCIPQRYVNHCLVVNAENVSALRRSAVSAPLNTDDCRPSALQTHTFPCARACLLRHVAAYSTLV